MSTIQRIMNSHGEELQIAVARHSTAQTFTFDLTVPYSHAHQLEGYDGHLVLSCQNTTRAELEEHVRNCQAALDTLVPELDGAGHV